MVLASGLLIPDSGYQNILRRVPQGAVLYYPALPEGFEQSTIKDFSGNANHGAITGATWTRLPSGLPALDFDGTDDNIIVADSASLRTTSNMTLEAWINYDTVGAAGDYYQIVAKDVVNKRSYMFSISFVGVADADTQLYVAISKTTAGAFSTVNNLVTKLKANTWWHVAMTYKFVADGTSELRTYVNGIPGTAITNAVGPIAFDDNSVYIGQREYAAIEQRFKGRIPLVKINNTTLSAATLSGHCDQEHHLFGV